MKLGAPPLRDLRRVTVWLAGFRAIYRYRGMIVLASICWLAASTSRVCRLAERKCPVTNESFGLSIITVTIIS